jgi:hypothetical protein
MSASRFVTALRRQETANYFSQNLESKCRHLTGRSNGVKPALALTIRTVDAWSWPRVHFAQHRQAEQSLNLIVIQPDTATQRADIHLDLPHMTD